MVTKASLLPQNSIIAYNICMEVEWDPNKADINRQKHGVQFSDAEAVLFDPMVGSNSVSVIGYFPTMRLC